MADYKVSIGANTTQLVKDVNTALKGVKAEIDIKVNSSSLANLGKLDSQLISNAKAEGKLATAVAKTETALSKQTIAQQKAIQETNKTTISNEKVQQAHLKTATAIDKATKSNKSFGQSFVDSTKKVFQFGLSTAVIGLFTSAIYSAWEEVKNLDSSITELKKVTDLGGESLSKYKQEAYDLASELKTSATNVTDAVTEFSKSGFTLEESMALGKSALVFQTIADGAITASDASTVLVQTLKAYEMEVADATKVIDSINEV